MARRALVQKGSKTMDTGSKARTFSAKGSKTMVQVVRLRRPLLVQKGSKTMDTGS